jgi:hypothetical protein
MFDEPDDISKEVGVTIEKTGISIHRVEKKGHFHPEDSKSVPDEHSQVTPDWHATRLATAPLEARQRTHPCETTN